MEEGRDWLTKEEAIAFIGSNSGYYLEKWKNNRGMPDRNGGGNWVALFFPYEWLCYRKMYRELAMTLFCVMCMIIILLFLPVYAEHLVLLFCRGINIFFAIFANGLYRKKAIRTLQKTDGMQEEERLEYLSEKGGTSKAALAVCILLEICLVLVS